MWRRLAGVLLAVGGCGGGGGGPFGVPAGTSGGSTSGSSGVAEEPSSGNGYEPCMDDEDCQGLTCSDGVCLSCGGHEDQCQDDELCVEDSCRPLAELDACQTVGVSICGDGVLQAPELCDGGAGCKACERDVDVHPWGDPFLPITADAVAFDVAPDGTLAALTTDNSQTQLYVLAPSGSTRVVRLLDESARGVRWAGGRLFVWGDDAGDAVVLGVDGDGEERWRLAVPDVGLGGAWPLRDAVLLRGSFDPTHSPSTRGIVVVVGVDGDLRLEALQGDVVAVSAAAPVGDDVVLAGRHVDNTDRAVVRRISSDGEPRWSDAGLPWTSAPIVVFPDGDGSWAIDTNGTAILFDAAGARARSIPCLGSVKGWATRAAAGPALALQFQVILPEQDVRPSWIAAGSPTAMSRAWLIPDGVSAMAWTPRETLLLALVGGTTLVEVIP